MANFGICGHPSSIGLATRREHRSHEILTEVGPRMDHRAVGVLAKYRGLVGVVPLVLAVACGSAVRADPTSSTTRSVPRVSLITAPSPVSQPSDTLVDAVLRYDVDMGCLYLDADGLRLFAVWPPGTAWADNPVGVDAADGSRLASIGDRVTAIRTVSLGVGVLFPTSGPQTVCGAQTGNFALVGFHA